MTPQALAQRLAAMDWSATSLQHQLAVGMLEGLPCEEPPLPDTVRAVCTLCAKIESPGFYTGCMIEDGHDCGDWRCDGQGNLTRKCGEKYLKLVVDSPF